MPKFVIERQYLLPMYQHIVVEAENLDEACKKGISDDVDWDTQEMDCDNARATTIAEAKVILDGYDLDQSRYLLIASRDPRAHKPPRLFWMAFPGCEQRLGTVGTSSALSPMPGTCTNSTPTSMAPKPP
jgi:hypothetical protein